MFYKTYRAVYISDRSLRQNNFYSRYVGVTGDIHVKCMLLLAKHNENQLMF